MSLRLSRSLSSSAADPRLSSLRRFRTTMAQLQQGTLLNHRGMSICSTSFCTGELFTRSFNLKTRSAPSALMTKHLKNQEAVNGFTRFHGGLSFGLLHARPVLSIIAADSSFFSIRLKFPGNEALATRFYSQSSRPFNQNDDASVRDGIRGVTGLGFKGFKKNWKKAKQLAAQSKKSAASSPIVSGSSKEDISVDVQEKIADTAKEVNLSSSSVTSLASGAKQDKSIGRRELARSKKSKEQKRDPLKKDSKSAAQGEVSDQKKGESLSASNLKAKSGGSHPDSKELLEAPASAKRSLGKKVRNSKQKSVKTSVEPMGEKKDQAINKASSPSQRILKSFYPPEGRSVVVVESVTKAKVIQGYLGDMFEVIPSYGHVRDLAARSGSVRPDDDFSMVWEVPSAAWTHLKSIKVALSGADSLILASDPDREGEAIAWHIIEMLQQQDALRDDMTIARVVFHEITESSIKAALKAPREIDANLVHAYLARRALDYLIGFNISPILWRKLPGCQSAGRVQSAALALVCDREMEIDQFVPQEYWSLEVDFERSLDPSLKSISIPSRLTYFASTKLNQLSVGSYLEAKDIEEKIRSEGFKIVVSKSNKMRRNPPTPYITSTLQQDAANKLHFPATYTMKLAQKLYEGVQLSDGKAVGLITYIRTDGLHISEQAVKDIRSLVIDRYGSDFAAEAARKYFKKVKNAQEAHEAIRPTDIRRLPSWLVNILDEDSLKLYTLIWSRTIACQMEPAVINQIHVEIKNADGSIVLNTSSSKIGFLGYQAVFKDLEAETVRSKENEGNERDEAFEVLSSLKVGDLLTLSDVRSKQHYTQPPSRYSEGALVKKLEELGIGRPSTYASTLKVLQDRNYVTVKARVLHPEFRGRMVSAFLSHHFSEVTDYSFTADMETELDNVSAGLTEWKGLLKDYWARFSSYCNRTATVHIHQVEKMLEKTFGDFLFASLPDKSRKCPSCMEGTLIFKVSRFGAGYFIGCDQHPKCKYIAKTLYGDEEEEDATPQTNNSIEEPKLLGLHPGSNEKILLKNGPYGYYVQLGEDRKGYIPKRASISQTKEVDSITIEDALELFRYPVTLGNHPKDGQPVILKLSKVGFTVRHRRTMASVPKNLKPADVTMEKALELLSGKDVRRSGRPKNKPKSEEALEVF
ncbi:hypothetical protein NL676_034900 [Syzygium grande]|nr:hypothetical protein NL676_034900 [Syzygium grande]